MWRKLRSEGQQDPGATRYQNDDRPEWLMVWRDLEGKIRGFELPLGTGVDGPYMLRFSNGNYAYGRVHEMGLMSPTLRPTIARFDKEAVCLKFIADSRYVDGAIRTFILDKIKAFPGAG